MSIDASPQHKALEEHLARHGFHSSVMFQLAVKALAIAQIAADEDRPYLLDQRALEIDGKPVPISKVITFLHLNSFVDWGGGEV